MKNITIIYKKGYNLGKKAKLSQSRLLRLSEVIEKGNYNKFLENIMFICVGAQVDIPIELINTESEDYYKIAQSFMMGVNNGTFSKEGI